MDQGTSLIYSFKLKWPIAAFPAIVLGAYTASLLIPMLLFLAIELVSVIVVVYTAAINIEFEENTLSGMFLEHYLLDTSEEVSLTLIISIFFCRVLSGVFFFFSAPSIGWAILLLTMLHKKT